VTAAPKRARLRATFEEVPDLYDRVRPRYPEPLFDDLVELCGLADGSRVLEIGPGTGQATTALAERGFAVVAVELGPRLAQIARRNLRRFPAVDVVTADFETWEPEPAPDPRATGSRARASGGFDAILSFTAFHWIDPGVRYSKPARLLGRCGALAVVETDAVCVEGGDPFWVEVQEDYDAVVPSPDNRPPPAPEEVGDLAGEIAATRLYEDAIVRRYLWDVEYTADEWIAVMDTYSPNRALDPDTRRRLFERIHRRIEARPGKRVRKHYLATLNVARRR
jgi:SAM-dependent methyltransferase